MNKMLPPIWIIILPSKINKNSASKINNKNMDSNNDNASDIIKNMTSNMNKNNALDLIKNMTSNMNKDIMYTLYSTVL